MKFANVAYWAAVYTIGQCMTLTPAWSADRKPAVLDAPNELKGCHMLFATESSHGKNLPYSSNDRCCTPNVIPNGIEYGWNADNSKVWCSDGTPKRTEDACGFNLENADHEKVHIHGVHWYCDKNLDSYDAESVSSCLKPSAPVPNLAPITQNIGAIHADLSEPALTTSDTLIQTPAPVKITKALRVPAKVTPHVSSGLAPADEYFGHSNESVLGMRNTLKDSINYLYYGTKTPAQIDDALTGVLSGIADLRAKYPKETMIPKLEAAAAWVLIHNQRDGDPLVAEFQADISRNPTHDSLTAIASGESTPGTVIKFLMNSI